MFSSNITINMYADQITGMDFFLPTPAASFSAPATSSGDSSASAYMGRNEEDDDWGDFVDSSVYVSRAGSLPPDPNGFVADHNGSASSMVAQLDSPSRIGSSQTQWVKPRGPVPLSVFGEVQEEKEGERHGSGPSVPSLSNLFDSASSKHNNGNGSVSKVMITKPSVAINDFIANLYRDNGQDKPENGLISENNPGLIGTSKKNSQRNSLNFNGNLPNWGSADIPVPVGSSDLELNDTDLSKKVLNSVAGMETLSCYSLNFDTQRLGPKSDAMNSNISELMLDRNDSNSGLVDQNDDIDEDDGWEFKTADSKSQTGDSKLVEQKAADNGPAAVSNTSNLSWNFWSLPTNGIGPKVDDGKTNVDNSVSDSGNEEDDSWDNYGWAFKVAETGEPKNDTASEVEGNDKKDGKSAEFAVASENGVHQVDDSFSVSSQQSSGWGLGYDFNATSKTETTTFLNSISQSQPYENETVPNFFPRNCEGTTWRYKQSSLETDTQKEEKQGIPDVLPANFRTHLFDAAIQKKELQPEKPKGPLALSLFGEEDLKSSDPVVLGDIPSSIHDSSLRDKAKAIDPLSISDLISSLYGQVEEMTTVNMSEKGNEIRRAVIGSNLVNEEDDTWEFQGPTESTSASGAAKSVGDVDDDSWEFQGPIQTITEYSIAEGFDGFDGDSWEFQGPAQSISLSGATKSVGDVDNNCWEFQGPMQTITESGVAEGVDEFNGASWEFQGPTQSVTVSDLKKGDNNSLEFDGVSVGNGTLSQTFAPACTREQHQKQVMEIEVTDFRDLFDKLKTELCYVALNHLENMNEDRSLVAESSEVPEAEKRVEEIQDMRKKLHEDVLLNEVNLESLEPRPSGISAFANTLKELKFRVLDSEFHMSEQLLSVEKDWNSTIELLKHAVLTLKILNLGSSEQLSNYLSTWFTIASTCAQELRHAVSIWKQVEEKNIRREILSASHGKNYILALGEVYRVAKILLASTRLYKPWILLAPGSNLLALLNESASLWSSSGLEDALLNISDLHNDRSAAQLLESIKHIDELDAFTLHSRIILAREPTCHISGLPAEIIPGMKTVEWNGVHCFMALANLWVNLISHDPPLLPHSLLGNQSFLTTVSIAP